jgi:outer membrane protein OmpA-like peptidoglycan-associated protein
MGAPLQSLKTAEQRKGVEMAPRIVVVQPFTSGGKPMQKTKQLLAVACLSSFVVAGCQTKAGTGAFLGAGAGGAAGAGIGALAGGGKGAAIGAIIGAAVGGTTGVLIGHHMDKRAEQLDKDLKDAKVERVGEGILVTFNSGILFDVNEADLKAAAKANINELAKVLERYDDTDIVIAGHTDSSGKPEYNKELSERRAEAVAKYAEGQGIKGVRIRTVGDGEEAPVADNDSEEGRAKNRRVEVAIFANDRMKKAVEKEGK